MGGLLRVRVEQARDDPGLVAIVTPGDQLGHALTDAHPAHDGLEGFAAYHLQLAAFFELRDAGLDSIPGGGAEILDDGVRHKISRLKCSTQEWIDVHLEAHRLGMRTTATMMFGCGETIEQRVNHLDVVRRIQEETGGFTAFIPWTFQPENTELAFRNLPEVTAAEYLRLLALTRIYFDNIPNVQVSWLTVGLKIGQVGLRFGVNDMGSIMIEENVISAAGARNRANDGELRRVIEDTGFIARQRTTLYERYVN